MHFSSLDLRLGSRNCRFGRPWELSIAKEIRTLPVYSRLRPFGCLVDVLSFSKEAEFRGGERIARPGLEHVQRGQQDEADEKFHDEAAHNNDGERAWPPAW
jgi:hypothetical protein